MNSLYLLAVVYKGRFLVTKSGLHDGSENEGSKAIYICSDPTDIQYLKDDIDRIDRLLQSRNPDVESEKIMKKYPIFGETRPLQNLSANVYRQYAYVINLDTEELEIYDDTMPKNPSKRSIIFGTMAVQISDTCRFDDLWETLDELFEEGEYQKMRKSWRKGKC